MVDVNRALRTAAQTGRVIIGFKESLAAVRDGDAKLVVVARNAPDDLARDIRGAAQDGGVPVYSYKGTNQELGPASGNPFAVAVLAVAEAGESEVLQLARATNA